MRTDELDFELPPGLIAQTPAERRSGARLLHYRRAGGDIADWVFADLPGLLRAGDVLVMNNARVEPARFVGRKPTGGKVEGLWLGAVSAGVWRVMFRHLEGATTVEAGGAVLRVVASEGEGVFRVETDYVGTPEAWLAGVGRMPLPPYIKRGKEADPRDAADRERYQTVYAQRGGSVAAPTAGLHFDEAVLAELDRRGVLRATVTLDVGIGTFRPVSAETLDGHVMHVERFEIGEGAAGVINSAKREGRRVIAVGTTSARVLESRPAGEIEPGSGETGIFIRPGYEWRHVGGLITNFHLPRSTLIALVAAWVGLEEQRRIYAHAIGGGYRFFSYGDSSFLE